MFGAAGGFGRGAGFGAGAAAAGAAAAPAVGAGAAAGGFGAGRGFGAAAAGAAAPAVGAGRGFGGAGGFGAAGAAGGFGAGRGFGAAGAGAAGVAAAVQTAPSTYTPGVGGFIGDLGPLRRRVANADEEDFSVRLPGADLVHDDDVPHSAELNFGTLLADAKQRNAKLDSHGLPKIVRRMEQIEEDSKRLASKASRQSDFASSSRGHMLLARRGYDSVKVTRAIQDLGTPFARQLVVGDTDVDGHLAAEHGLTVVTALLEAKKDAMTAFNAAALSAMQTEWATLAEQLRYAGGGMGGGGGGLDSSLGSSFGGGRTLDMTASLLQPAGLLSGQGLLTPKMELYAACVANPRGHRSYGLIAACADAAARRRSQDVHNAEIVDAWAVLRSMVGESSEASCAGPLPRGPDTTLRLVQGGRVFLEAQYLAMLRAFVAADRGRRRGGEAASGLPLDDIEAYVEIKFGGAGDVGGGGGGGARAAGGSVSSQQMLGAARLYAVVYLCLRTGCHDEAREVLRRAGDASEQRQLLDALDNLRAGTLPERPGSTTAWRKFEVYRKAVYAVLFATDSHFRGEAEKQLVFATTQDFVWLRLQLAGASRDQLDGQLSELADAVLSAREHFAAESPVLLFQLLLLTHQFGLAVVHLLGSAEYRIEAVHFALALSAYGLLAPSSFASPMGKAPALDVPKLISHYTRQFAKTAPAYALGYLLFLPEPEPAITRLLVETREYDVIVEALELLVRNGRPLDVSRICAAAARDCARRLEHLDAISLFYKARAYDDVFAVLNQRMAKVLSAESAERIEVRDVAGAVAQRLVDDGQVDTLSPGTVSTFNTLQRLLDYFDLARAGQLEEAVNELESLGLVPADASALDRCVADFESADPSTIKANMAEIVLTHMGLLHRLYVKARGQPTPRAVQNLGRMDLMRELKERARVLVTFASLVQIAHRLPGDVNAKLLEMEVSLA